MKYYDGTKLLNIKDINGNKPSILGCDGNRGCGKTVYFNRYAINRFKKHGEKFIILYRYKCELENVASKFFGDIGGLFFPDDVMTEKSQEHGLYVELKLNKITCGYAMAINSAYKLKKLSHLFTDVALILFDEFQNDMYVPNEVTKFITIYESVARGHGQAVRDVKVILMCNHISDMNPYYRAWGLVKGCSETIEGFIKGEGVVIEKVQNYEVVNAKITQGFFQAFSDTKAIQHSLYNKSLLETSAFIEEIKDSNFTYLCNFECDGHMFALKSPSNHDKVSYYFTNKVDYKVKARYVFSMTDHNNETVMTGAIKETIDILKRCFEMGRLRFSDVETKTYALMLMSLLDEEQYN